MKPSVIRTFLAYVEDRPGVLNRVTSLFRRRGYNIESLTVGRTERPGVSRVTLVLDMDDDAARRLEANLYKLVNVLWVKDVTEQATVVRDLALIKVRADAPIAALSERFRARVVDTTADVMIVEITGTHSEIDKMLEELRPFGIVEMVRTGAIAMTSGASEDPSAKDPKPTDQVAAA